jgi:hypothetical protein
VRAHVLLCNQDILVFSKQDRGWVGGCSGGREVEWGARGETAVTEFVCAGESRYGTGERTLCLSVKIKIKLYIHIYYIYIYYIYIYHIHTYIHTYIHIYTYIYIYSHAYKVLRQKVKQCVGRRKYQTSYHFTTPAPLIHPPHHQIYTYILYI